VMRSDLREKAAAAALCVQGLGHRALASCGATTKDEATLVAAGTLQHSTCTAPPHLAEEGEEAVLQLHGDALERLLGALRAQQAQDHRLVLPVHLAAGDLEQQVVGDLPRGAGHGHHDGRLPARDVAAQVVYLTGTF
jgi:hypothetical protein